VSDDQVATTSDGDPCSLCQERDGYCHHHDGNPETTAGRPTAITEDDHEDILEAAREGVSKRGCARMAGASVHALERYLEQHDEFRHSFMQARARGEMTLIRDGLRDDETDAPMAKFLLATSFDHVKEEKRSVENDHSGDVSIDITHHRVTDDDD
jgi:hypothetical protein